jgi:hypothetical protein
MESRLKLPVNRCEKKMIALLRAKPFKNVTVGSIVGGLLVACLLALGTLYGLTIPHRSRARAFLHDFVDLKLGESTFADAQRLAQTYGGIPWYVTATDMRCTFERCRLAFQFDNMPLSYVPRVGYTRFLALIHVRNGIVVGREMDYERAARSSGYFRYEVFDSELPLEKGWRYGVWRLNVDPEDLRGVPHVLKVNLGPPSTASLRERAYSVNLSCLARFYGCGGPSVLYPPGLSYLGPPYQGLVQGEQ